MASATQIIGPPTSSILTMLAKMTPTMSPDELDNSLALAIDILSKKNTTPRPKHKLTTKEDEKLQLVGGLLVLLQSLLRQNPDTVKETYIRQCLKSLKFNEECLNHFVNYFLENKQYLYGVRQLPQYYLQLTKLDWRVDITLSSSTLNRSVSTVIIMNMRFANGEERYFEITLAKFHLLRLYVAALLKEFHAIEKK